MMAEARRRLGNDCALADDVIGARLAQLRADMAAARAMTYMVMSRAEAGVQDCQSSLMGAMVGETQQGARRRALDILGPQGLAYRADDDGGYLLTRYFSCTVGDGTQAT